MATLRLASLRGPLKNLSHLGIRYDSTRHPRSTNGHYVRGAVQGQKGTRRVPTIPRRA
jgi:hypothetical protein